jgi:hypothetical protein
VSSKLRESERIGCLENIGGDRNLKLSTRFESAALTNNTTLSTTNLESFRAERSPCACGPNKQRRVDRSPPRRGPFSFDVLDFCVRSASNPSPDCRFTPFFSHSSLYTLRSTEHRPFTNGHDLGFVAPSIALLRLLCKQIHSNMLAGIKTGKKKQKKAAPKDEEDGALIDDRAGDEPRTRPPPLRPGLPTGNEAVAAALRQQLLLTGGTATPAERQPTTTTTTNASAALTTAAIVLLPGESSTTAASKKAEEDMTMAELLVHEKMQMSLADQEVRGIVRQKRPRKSVADDSDEEEERQSRQRNQIIETATPAAAQRRDHSRGLAQWRRTEGITQQCWWWIESTRFSEHLLLSASSAVTLSLNRAHASLIAGRHWFLTPIPHTPSLAACDETVWSELRQYQQSLRAMAAAEEKNQAVIFWETVLPNNNSGRGIWQTRLEAVMVPLTVLQDAPMYFRSALAEQAEEWGTHQKLRTITTGPRHAVPSHFSYFYVEYAPDHGHLQMIETAHFPKDFGADTVAGIMDLEPMRLRGRRQPPPTTRDNAASSSHDEQGWKDSFLAKYKAFDWTTQS